MEWIKKMWAKKLELLGSRRFWILTITAVLALLKLDPATTEGVLTVVQAWLIGIATVGTIDSFGRKAGGIK